jgi:hypothetical protein
VLVAVAGKYVDLDLGTSVAMHVSSNMTFRKKR